MYYPLSPNNDHDNTSFPTNNANTNQNNDSDNNNNNDEENLNNDEEYEYDEDDEDDDYEEESFMPECPYCSDTEGCCDHVIVNYDASFGYCESGYLSKTQKEIDALKTNILKLIRQGVEPKTKNRQLLDIWEYALSDYTPDTNEISFDDTAYYNFLHHIISEFDGESETYSDSDSAPGYSSSYIICYAEEPQETLKAIHKQIIKELKSK
jgi:hypothetical protein